MEQMTEEIRALLDAEGWLITNLANTAAVIYERMQDINWAGFYLMRQGELQLGPFQGKAACLRIPLGKGVCGTAAAQGQTQGVEDVHAFAGHIACDAAIVVSKSWKEGRQCRKMQSGFSVAFSTSPVTLKGVSSLTRSGILSSSPMEAQMSV